MAGYTKDFLIDAFLDRFVTCSLVTIEQMEAMETMANKFYDEVGRDKFRVYASLDAEALKIYKAKI